MKLDIWFCFVITKSSETCNAHGNEYTADSLSVECYTHSDLDKRTDSVGKGVT